MLKRIFALLRKELLAIFKDPKSRFVVLGPPLIQLVIFGYAASYDLNHVPFALYNEDPGSASRELAAQFAGSPSLKLVRRVDHQQQIRDLIDSRSVLLVIHIGPHFSRQLAAGGPAPVQAIIDGRNSNSAMIALNYIRDVSRAFENQWRAREHRAPLPAHLVVRAWFNPNLESQWFIVPGIIGLLTLVVTMVVTAMSVAREREQGTFDQLLVTPLRPLEILIGKALPGFLIGFAEASLIIALAVFWFQVPLLGSLWTLYAGLALFLLSAIGVGLVISSLAVTQQQALLGAFLFLVPAIILSGFATPISNMPEIVQRLTLLDPLRYFMVVLRGVFLEGASLRLLAHQLWPMSVIGVICLGAATWLFRHRMA